MVWEERVSCESVKAGGSLVSYWVEACVTGTGLDHLSGHSLDELESANRNFTLHCEHQWASDAKSSL